MFVTCLVSIIDGHDVPCESPGGSSLKRKEALRWERTRPQSLYVWRLKRSRLRREFHSRIANQMAPFVNDGWLLDVGCGPGFLAEQIACLKSPGRFVGIDIDRGMLKIAKDKR